MGEADHFIHALQEGLRSMVGGLELSPLDKSLAEACELDLRAFTQKLNQAPDLVPRFEALLEGWCNQIESYLNPAGGHASSAAAAAAAAAAGGSDSGSSEDVGPKGELEHWRNRMQRLTSITEQLKRRDCKAVVGLLSALTKSAAEAGRQRVAALLRRWKQIDVDVTEAANEAKDNVKYLSTLDRFVEPLYAGSAASIVDALPALMNSVKMIHTIARYYNTSARMTGLFVKITNQMIATCKVRRSV
jgi:dynein heavy chain, axonemal